MVMLMDDMMSKVEKEPGIIINISIDTDNNLLVFRMLSLKITFIIYVICILLVMNLEAGLVIFNFT